jgi:Ankyrin repeats (3 copies)/Ankyrin repeats (many copies)
VFCQLELLRYTFPSNVQRILEELPEGLDETYERILREIRKPNRGHAHRLLQSLVAAVRPLRVKELAEVLAVDFTTKGFPKLNLDWRLEDQEEAVMSACSSLVIIVKEGDSHIVQFSHFSVKEFLMSERLAEPIKDVSHYYIQLKTAHTIFAQACLGVLLRLDHTVDRDNIEDFPLARYAAQYWNAHARVEGVSSCIEEGMKRLFDRDGRHLATWLWIHNEDSQGHSISTERPGAPDAGALYYAALLGFCVLAEHLIAEHPGDVNARGGMKMTPLHAAVSAGHRDILTLLLDHRADVNVQDRLGQTPLHRASSNGKVEVGQCLLDGGADINARDNDRWTPLFHAASQGHLEFTRMLIGRGAEVDARDTSDKTPLHRAVQTDNSRVVQLLLESGADVNAHSGSGKTPLELASLPEIEELLSKYGTKSEDS